MSHTSTAEIKAAKIRCEELVRNARTLLTKYNFRSEVLNQIEKQYGLKEIERDLEKNNSSSETYYSNVLQQCNRINTFISNIESFLVLNLSVNANDYNEKVSMYATEFIKNDQTILEKALEGVDSNIKKKYILSRFMSNKYSFVDELLKDVEKDLKNSSLYQEELVRQNLKALSQIKNIKVNNADDVNKAISVANQEISNEEVSIAVRNRVVTSIIKIIREQGFIVRRENVVTQGDEAIIMGIKPNGEEARFKVNLNGKFAYKFHKYEGLSCEKDINNFESLFESIYGVKIENKNIIWSNPDRLDKMAHQTMNNNKIGG